jgi:predicted ABC-type ATPase
MADDSPTVIVLAGPNGAGKTTASRTLLAETLSVMTFVNADVIAQGLSGFDPESVAVAAGRIMLDRLHELAEQRASFAFETTLAARTFAGWLDGLRQSGYTVDLAYFWLASEELAVGRVAQRVQAGGHDVPEETIRRRYRRGVHNLLHLYRPIVSLWRVYNTTLPGAPQPVARGDITGALEVFDEVSWQAMHRVTES